MAKLASLNGWELLLVLLALATAVGLGVWAIVWVMWMVRPLLTGAAALTAVTLTLRALRQHRATEEWKSTNDWIAPSRYEAAGAQTGAHAL
jgi:hypothetical protein